MLYSLSPSTKRKYSNLKQLVGRQIVKRNKKTPQQVSPQGDEQLQRKGISKRGARQSAKVTLRDNMHAGKVTGSSEHAGLLKQGGSGGRTGGWCRLSCAHGNSCVDMHKMLGGRVGWVGGDEQLSEGCTERWEELGEFKIFNCNWLYFCSH